MESQHCGSAGHIELFTSVPLLIEFEEVLNRPKFAQRLKLAQVTPRELVLGYAALATVVLPAVIARTILADPDDDEVRTCAIAAQATVIVSGDSHLLTLQQYEQISILTAPALLAQLKRHP